MGLFGKKSAKTLPPLLSSAEIDGASYDQVLDFLVSVNKDDFDKIIKVAGLYRKTHCDVAKVTGLTAEPQPSIFEDQTIAPQVAGTPLVTTPGAKAPDTEAGDFLTDDDLNNAFLDDDEPTPPAAPAAPAEPAAPAPAADPTKIDVVEGS